MEQKKMSKSDNSDLSRINLTDEKDLIINKIKKLKLTRCLCHQELMNFKQGLKQKI